MGAQRRHLSRSELGLPRGVVRVALGGWTHVAYHPCTADRRAQSHSLSSAALCHCTGDVCDTWTYEREPKEEADWLSLGLGAWISIQRVRTAGPIFAAAAECRAVWI